MVFSNLADHLEIPKDVSRGAPVLKLLGQYEVFVENYKKILEYSDGQIKIQAKSCKVFIKGEHLQIDYLNETGMKVSGRIKCIELI